MQTLRGRLALGIAKSLLATVFVAPALSIGAQQRASLPEESQNQQLAPFLEKAYFAFASPTGKNLRFEGRPTVHYFLFNQYSDKVWQKGEVQPSDGKSKRWAFAWPVSALFEVRMTDTVSDPVRTPSYRIRPFNLQGVRIFHDTADLTRFRLLGIAISAAHYSNGQQGCTYLGFERTTPGADCSVRNADTAARQIPNTIDGDFSTSYFCLAVDHRWARLFGTSDPLAWQFTLGGSLQLHPLELKPGGMNGAQAATYGQHQYSLRSEYERRFPSQTLQGVARLAGEYEERFGGGLPKRLRRGSLEVSYVLDRQSHVGIFLRQHWGFDYYNINFGNKDRFFSWGMMWDIGRFDLLERSQ